MNISRNVYAVAAGLMKAPRSSTTASVARVFHEGTKRSVEFAPA
jgi:hypothetical protein